MEEKSRKLDVSFEKKNGGGASKKKKEEMHWLINYKGIKVNYEKSSDRR